MKNVVIKKEGNLLVIKVDLTKDFGPSKSGKTTIVATTEGNHDLEGVTIGLNVYKRAPR
jgi:hypothetical protein